MSNIKKITAGILSSTMMFSLASCSTNLGGADISYVAEIDGIKVPAGVYIFTQMNAYFDAIYYIDDTKDSETTETEAETTTTAVTEFKDKIIEGKSVSDWINDKTFDDVKEIIAVEKKFDELGLEVTDLKKQEINYSIDNMWTTDGDALEGYGISKESMIYYTLNGFKRTEIFYHYYGKDGEMAVPEEDIRTYLTENHAKIDYIDMILKDGEGNMLKSDGKAEVEKMANDYIDRINGGEDFNAVLTEYNDYYDELTGVTEEEEEVTEVEVSYLDENVTDINPSSMTPNDKVVAAIFDGTIPDGEIGLVMDDENYYVVKNIGIFEDEEFYDSNYEATLYNLKGDEYNETVTSWTESQEITKNEAALKAYDYTAFEE